MWSLLALTPRSRVLGFPGGSDGKELAVRETWVQSLG